MLIDKVKSHDYWKGTKMRGSGKHEGIVNITQGYFIKQNSHLLTGSFVIDMRTIEVTDIPNNEPVPRKNLINHLKSPDFFDVERFPTARFETTQIEKLGEDSLIVAGNLTIKEVTKNVRFTAQSRQGHFTTKFTIERYQWNIAYQGNWVDKILGDQDIGANDSSQHDRKVKY